MAIMEFLTSLKRNMMARGVKDVSDPKKWAAYLEGGTIEKEGIHIPYSEITAYTEQLVYRTTLCQECCEAGVCPHCGCTMPKAAMVASKTCPKERWGAMMVADEWQAYKQEKQISFTVNQSAR
ncbi:MAG: Unknown protein [uncultured Thiotrichaceae bacterium]|uniref:Uncharacterized protein n=1 Tax=uncultured Thiotrichaceae bacterium TaxID=298394 RepID=A0A6S6SYI9_9GAMM|nr:MAG: Unknown protein [uncultured Thiotrichaceae bacterium]